jgi:Zn-dependent protease/CBS domain-containing protein
MNFVVTHIWGIPIGLNFSWLIIFALLMFSLATGLFPSALPGLSAAVVTLAALFTTLLFFGSLLAHELGHAYVALREHIPVRGISLFIFGGVAQIDKEPETPGAEFRIAAAGPLVSFLLGGLFFVIAQLPLPGFVTFAATWLARINLILGAFNLIPGFPLDGGRLLRALLWKLSGNAYRSTKIAAISGQLVAMAFISFGVLSAFTSNVLNGLWMAFIGWFLLSAASNSLAYASFQKRLKGTHVSEVMRSEIPYVPGFMSLKNLVQQYVLGLGHHVMYVGNGITPEGVISLENISQIGQARWPFMTTEQAMTPLHQLVPVDPETDLVTTLGLMDSRQLTHLPVVKDGQVIGLISREDIIKLIEVRRKLKVN